MSFLIHLVAKILNRFLVFEFLVLCTIADHVRSNINPHTAKGHSLATVESCSAE